MPFDRLVRSVDAWAAASKRTDVFAQIGRTHWRPSHVEHTRFIEPRDFDNLFSSASIVIGHAGMGTILSALRFQKPVLVMPRRASLGEQRNDHQLATARRLLELGKIHVAFDENELIQQLERIDELKARSSAGPYASASLLEVLEAFIQRGVFTDPSMAPTRGNETPADAPPLAKQQQLLKT